MTKEKLDLDAALREWPLPARSDLDWDEGAERIAAAATSGKTAKSSATIGDEALFAAPLAQLPEEVQSSARLGMSTQPAATGAAVGRLPEGTAVESKMGNSSDRGGRDRSSFSDLAKLAGTPSVTPAPPQVGVVRGEEASKDDSGIVDLKAIASADPSGEMRAQATPLASEGLFDDAPPPAAPSSSGAVAPVAAAASTASKAPTAVAAVAAPKEEKKKKGGGGAVVVIFGLLGAAAIAAGAFFYIQHKKATVAASNGPDTTKPVPVAAAPTPSASVASADTAAAPDDQPDQVPDPTNPTKKSMGKFKGVPGSKPGVAAGGAGSAAPSSTVDPRLVFGGVPQTSGGSGGDLDDEMRKRVGGKKGDPTLTPAAGTTNSNAPPKPSQGQVAGAVNVVLPAARGCLNADDPISKATLVFQSDGSVLSVTVTGFAAGKPAEGCVRSALSKAKVPAFSDPSYSFPVTIRGTN